MRSTAWVARRDRRIAVGSAATSRSAGVRLPVMYTGEVATYVTIVSPARAGSSRERTAREPTGGVVVMTGAAAVARSPRRPRGGRARAGRRPPRQAGRAAVAAARYGGAAPRALADPDRWRGSPRAR